jgi:site-specific recombinase XerD
MKSTTLAYLLHAFFHGWLTQQRNVSPHTIKSYRDTWRLFLLFVADCKHRSVSDLAMEDLTSKEVLAFLQHGEKERKITIGTRNCRLAAIRSFFRFVADHEPSAVAQCAGVLRIPTKKAPTAEVNFLDSEEITAILGQPDRSTIEGQRDHALLYNTGARIQEALDLSPRAVRFRSPAQVTLFGKGRKERALRIWRETADLLTALLRRQPRPDDQPIFVNRYGEPLGAAGVRFKLKAYIRMAEQCTPSLAKKHVTPHIFRHSMGVAMVAAGVDITVIRSLLGHVSLDMTNHYARANLETKRQALEKVDTSTRPSKPPRWKRHPDLLAWLNSL